jgi:hypothetical protein
MFFVQIAAANRHLTETDKTLVAAFVQAASLSTKLAKKADLAGWERATRVLMSRATKLRLTPQACIDPQTLGRRRKDDPGASYYDTAEGGGDK